MLTLQIPTKVKFICGFIYKDKLFYEKAILELQKSFGKIDFKSKDIPFIYTDYYTPEFGKPLIRNFIAFKRLQSVEKFVNIKLHCLKIEKKLSSGSKRLVNIDPGYINLAKLALLTTKDFSHRVYLGRAVFAEVTLQYTQKEFKDFPWTFPDYRTKEYKDIFIQIRNIYKKQLAQR